MSGIRNQPPAITLTVPAGAISGTLQLLQRAGQRECGVFWYGPRDQLGNGRVAYVTAPRQRMAPGNYGVNAAALTEIVNTLPTEWKILAQVHSHPGRRVEHSNYDDKMASSQKALSLVFPLYGRDTSPFPSGVGVHEWQRDYWHLLDEECARRRLAVVTGEVRVQDFR